MRASSPAERAFRTLLLLVGLLMLAVGGCRPGIGQGALNEAKTFEHEELGYSIAGKNNPVLGHADWWLVNFEDDEAKTEDGFRTTVNVVTRKGDKATEFTIPVWHLLFEHRRDNAIVAVQAIPMDGNYADKTLEALAEKLLNARGGSDVQLVTGGGQVKVSVGSPTIEKVVASQAMTLAGKKALAVTTDVYDSRALKLEGAPRPQRLRRVLVMAPRKWTFGKSYKVDLPTLLLFTYRSSVAGFDKHVAAFEAFLGRVLFKAQPADTSKK